MRKSRRIIALITVLALVLFVGATLCEAKCGSRLGKGSLGAGACKEKSAYSETLNAAPQAPKMAGNCKAPGNSVGIDIGGYTILSNPMKVAGL